MTVASQRAAIFLNTKRWSEAEAMARRVFTISPMEAAIAAFAEFEQSDLREARKHFLFAAFNNPLAVEILVNDHARKPRGALETLDYNGGIDLRATISAYLAARSSESLAFFKSILAHPDVQRVKVESSECAASHSRENDPTNRQVSFERWHEIKSMPFADKVAADISSGNLQRSPSDMP
jgi:hypothetical protein